MTMPGGTHMVSGGSARLDPALLSAFPKPFNFKIDIFAPGKVDRYMAALRHALSSRKMLQHLEERAPTMQEILHRS